MAIKGNSGCEIKKIKLNNNYVIVKSCNENYAVRLKRQIEKQKSETLIKTPKIIKETDNSVYMEYIEDSEFYKTLSFDNYKAITSHLINYINENLKNSKNELISSNIFKTKWNDIKTKCINYKLKAELVSKIDNIIYSLNDIILPIGKCHGDFTFSNILIKDNDVYLIDFLDSFIESPITDLVKLRQDTKYKWSSLMTSNEFDYRIFDKIDKIIIDTFDCTTFSYKIVELFNFLRIVPYCKSDEVFVYLTNIIFNLATNFYT
jgi:thiamine kinase-like enzyme